MGLLIPAVGLCSFALVVSGTGALVNWLKERRVLDIPNQRSSHFVPTPRGGGLMVVPAVLVPVAFLSLQGAGPAAAGAMIALGLSLLVLSWIDDRRGLSFHLRLCVHLGVASLGLAAMGGERLVFQGLLPFWPDRVLAVLAWGWFINLYNFMDGIDGITGVETLAVAGGLLLLPGEHLVPAAIAGASLGFLAWNWHPARIFLGDSGSVPLGFLLGWLLLDLAMAGQWAPALILPAYYLADATLTLARRALRGEKIWQAHREHFYQKAVQAGASHAHVATIILAADIVLVVVAVALAPEAPGLGLAAAALVVGLLLGLLAHPLMIGFGRS